MSLTTTASRKSIGGPGTWLPRPIESLLSWSLALSCLTVSGYYYLLQKVVSSIAKRRLPQLMTHSRPELEMCPLSQRLEQLEALLPVVLVREQQQQQHNEQQQHRCGTNEEQEVVSENMMLTLNADEKDDATMVAFIRSNEIVRRLVSLVMLLSDNTTTRGTRIRKMGETTRRSFQQTERRLQQLRRIWPRIYQLPAFVPLVDDAADVPDHHHHGSAVEEVPSVQHTTNTIMISLVVPCYRENMHHVVHDTLAHAAAVCDSPLNIQLLLVLAEDDDHVYDQPKDSSSAAESLLWNDLIQQGWGKVQLLQFTNGTGRGPCLNYGAKYATGHILSFCHSDTKLPTRWDRVIAQTLLPNIKTEDLPVACAFAFGIDDATTSKPLPPGIRAIVVTANIRCQLWSLPYGDQCLSIRRSVFEYVGGYPHQCIMEDYELVVLLRARGRIVTLSHHPALCSPRRWQKLGVLYVTYTNSYLVKQYKSGIVSAAEIYNQYYGNGGIIRVDDKSPWEEQLETLLALIRK